jgi:hypothetical protein
MMIPSLVGHFVVQHICILAVLLRFCEGAVNYWICLSITLSMRSVLAVDHDSQRSVRQEDCR